MRLVPRRRAGVVLRITPSTPVRPTETIRATVLLDAAIHGVTAARVELGYVNGYLYRWAGRHAAGVDDLDLLAGDAAGTDAGAHRRTTDWVAALDVPLPVAGGRLEAGSHDVDLHLPSWAPGSSDGTVRWEVRLRVERSGRDVGAEQTVAVVVPPDPDAVFTEERLDHGSADVRIALDRAWWGPGEAVRGTVTAEPRDAPLTGDLRIRLQRVRVSHPLVRTPAPDLILERPIVAVADGVVLAPGAPVAVPFAVELPRDADPTTESVHASIAWFVRADVAYPGQRGHLPDAVRRGFGVHTAPAGP